MVSFIELKPGIPSFLIVKYYLFELIRVLTADSGFFGGSSLDGVNGEVTEAML